jgi:glycosyltransferase involved in cell wall biosynthesis
MDDVTASVIIPTYNGALKIPGLMHALLRQSYQGFEVIVVVDGSTDNTEDILKPFRKAFKKFIVLNQDNKGRSIARNKGVSISKEKLLIFYDDDMEPEMDSIQKHISFHEKNSGVLCGNPIEDEHNNRSDIQNYKASLTKKWTAKYSQAVTSMNFSNLFFTAANSSMPRAIFERLNGFDERLTDAEDYDFAYRALQGGVQVYFDKGNRAYHHESITCLSYIRRLRHYNESHQRLQSLYPERSLTYQLHRSGGIKKFVYRIFASTFWVKLIDSGFFVPILPKKIRYKLYSVVIQSLAVEYATKSL